MTDWETEAHGKNNWPVIIQQVRGTASGGIPTSWHPGPSQNCVEPETVHLLQWCSLLLCFLRAGLSPCFSEGAWQGWGMKPLRQIHSRSQASLTRPSFSLPLSFPPFFLSALNSHNGQAESTFTMMTQPTSAEDLDGMFKGTDNKALICPRNKQVGASECEEPGAKGTWMTSTSPDEEAVE